MNAILNNKQMAAARRVMALNSSTSVLPWSQSVTYKHDLAFDFGYPRDNELAFSHFYSMWRRNGIARALVEKTSNTTWQTNPSIISEGSNSGEETPEQKKVREHLEEIRFWQNVQECDMRSMVGKYSALILQLGDGHTYDKPVERVLGGIKGLISVIPAWEAQLEPNSWDNDVTSPTYGKPTSYRFNESAVDPENGKTRTFIVHPDRVLIWSRDGTTFGDSKLEPCFNALMDIEKIRGAGGEGFWKNAKSQPILEADPDVDFTQLASMLGTDLDGLPDALDEVMAKWSKGFDDSLVVQGINVKNLPVRLPDPGEFFNIAVQEIAASWPIPHKTLVGMQTGERASTEDAREWAQTCMSRRNSIAKPNIVGLLSRFKKWGIMSSLGIEWPDLTAPTLDEKLAIAERMARVNQALFAASENAVFTNAEIREVAGYSAEPDAEDTPTTPEPSEDEDAPEV